MRNFLGYCGLLFLTLCFLLIGLDKIYSYVYQNSSPKFKVQEILQQYNKHYDVAFFGSSRTENHIDCRIVEEITGQSCINLGISGASLKDMAILMEIASLNNITFGKALVQVDYNYNHHGPTGFFKAGVIPFIHRSELKKIAEKLGENRTLLKIPFYRYLVYSKVLGIRSLINSITHQETNFEQSRGFLPKEGQGLILYGSFPEKLNDKNDDLISMKEWSKKNNSSLFFFTAPYCSRAKNRNVIEKLKLKLPRLKNYVALFDQHEEYFFNCGHLNKKGAQQFTRRITLDLLLQ